MLAAQFIEVVSAHFSEPNRLTPPLPVVAPSLVVGEFPSSSSRTGGIVDRSPGTPVAPVNESRLRRLRHLRPDEAGRPSRLGHKVDLVRRVPHVGEGSVVVQRDPSALLDGLTFVPLTALSHPQTRRALDRADNGVRRILPVLKLRPLTRL